MCWASGWGLSAPSSALGLRRSWQGPGQATRTGPGGPGRPRRQGNPTVDDGGVGDGSFGSQQADVFTRPKSLVRM